MATKETIIPVNDIETDRRENLDKYFDNIYDKSRERVIQRVLEELRDCNCAKLSPSMVPVACGEPMIQAAVAFSKKGYHVKLKHSRKLNRLMYLIVSKHVVADNTNKKFMDTVLS